MSLETLWALQYVSDVQMVTFLKWHPMSYLHEYVRHMCVFGSFSDGFVEFLNEPGPFFGVSHCSGAWNTHASSLIWVMYDGLIIKFVGWIYIKVYTLKPLRVAKPQIISDLWGSLTFSLSLSFASLSLLSLSPSLPASLCSQPGDWVLSWPSNWSTPLSISSETETRWYNYTNCNQGNKNNGSLCKNLIHLWWQLCMLYRFSVNSALNMTIW